MSQTCSPDSTSDELLTVPQHVAIIMDGNGRWAQRRGLPRSAGHRAGTENLRRIIEACVEYGVRVLTIYAFSTENWQRPRDEVAALMKLMSVMIDREMESLHRNGVQVRHIGSLDELPRGLQAKIRHAVELTSQNERLILNVAVNYGSRREIAEAVRALVCSGISPDEVTEESIDQRLYTAGLPDPDLVVRTAGEMRLSNFLLWQAAYAEFYATPILWPDFDRAEFFGALVAYSQRTRRFGGLSGAR